MPRQKRILTEEEKEKIAQAKAELREYRDNIKYIDGKLEDVEEVKGRVEKITPTISMTKTNRSSKSPDRFAEAISRLEELKIECTEKMKELLIKKFKIDDKIELLEQPYRNVLFFRYTRRMSWEDIADGLGYNTSYVYDLHGEALYIYSKL